MGGGDPRAQKHANGLDAGAAGIAIRAHLAPAKGASDK